jgi:predicted cobalt transporter CbtA
MQRIVMTALLAGALAGIAVFALHMWQTTPMILEAEVFENGTPAPAHAHGTGEAAGHAHAAAADDDAWPAPGLERNAYSLLADVVTAIGGASNMVRRRCPRKGDRAWGLIGNVVDANPIKACLSTAAPATVCGECGPRWPLVVLMESREGRADTKIREPGDLPSGASTIRRVCHTTVP